MLLKCKIFRFIAIYHTKMEAVVYPFSLSDKNEQWEFLKKYNFGAFAIKYGLFGVDTITIFGCFDGFIVLKYIISGNNKDRTEFSPTEVTQW